MESKWIWPFELLDKLGEGGMGVVYRARYVGNDRQVAVKLIPNEITADPTAVARFERELDVLKQLKHPNIVHCFGGSCESKQRFYAMEYINGGTLSDYLIEKGPLSWEKAVDFAIQMCEALHYAHEHGVIHRDVKPGNFLMTKTGQLKLSDFGLASIVSEGRLTAAGRTVGTILYMAPEQIRGQEVSNAADLYALGCVLFEMLVGKPPFSGNNAAEVLRKHLKEPIPHVIRLVPECPLELDELICELLAKNSDQRPRSAEAVENRLNGILLPSRRKSPIEPSLFASVSPKAASTVPVKSLRNSGVASQFRSALIATPTSALIPWALTGLMLIISVRMWFSWSESARQIEKTEQALVTVLDASPPEIGVVSAQALGKFPVLQPMTIEKLKVAANSKYVELRIAAVRALKQHPIESRAQLGELLRIKKSDESSEVRAEADLAIITIQTTSTRASPMVVTIWTVILIVIACLAIGGWRIWSSVRTLHRQQKR